MSNQEFSPKEINPLGSLDEWEDDLLERYPDPEKIASAKSTEAYRNYEEPARDTVREFYRLNHTYQTYDFVMEKRRQYLSFDKKEMPIWDAFDFLMSWWMILILILILTSFNICCKHQKPSATMVTLIGWCSWV